MYFLLSFHQGREKGKLIQFQPRIWRCALIHSFIHSFRCLTLIVLLCKGPLLWWLQLLGFWRSPTAAVITCCATTAQHQIPCVFTDVEQRRSRWQRTMSCGLEQQPGGAGRRRGAAYPAERKVAAENPFSGKSLLVLAEFGPRTQRPAACDALAAQDGVVRLLGTQYHV